MKKILFAVLMTFLATACAPMWQQQGYKSEESFKFASTLGNATPERVNALESWGVKSRADLDALIKEYKDIKYADDSSYDTIFDYLKDRRDAKKNNITTVQQKQNRLAEEKKAAEKRAAEEKRRKEEFAKKYPYEAILACEFQGRNMGSLYSCFHDSNSNGTELSLTNGDDVNIYKAHDLQRLGREQNDGLHIPLQRKFEIKGQNDSKDFILTLTIKNTATGEVLNKQKAGTWKLVYMKN